MNWKVTRVNTWWSADEASSVLAFLDELRDQLWHTHGERITALRLAELDTQHREERQGQLDLEEHIDF